MKKAVLLFAILVLPATVFGWANGPSGNSITDTASECDSPPYSTHDWIAENALMLLPDTSSKWLTPYKELFLLGTEAPDNKKIPTACHGPNNGYDDRRAGHSVSWNDDCAAITNDRNAVRAEEEYQNAKTAYKSGKLSDAAFFLGAMSHYITDISSYPHTISTDNHHSAYESWVQGKTTSFDHCVFSPYIKKHTVTSCTPRKAVLTISKAVACGKGTIESAEYMDAHYAERNSNPDISG